MYDSFFSNSHRSYLHFYSTTHTADGPPIVHCISGIFIHKYENVCHSRYTPTFHRPTLNDKI